MALPACSTHHWAKVQVSNLPPPPGPRVLHTSRLLVHVTDKTEPTQCVVAKDYRPVCFYNVRAAVEQGLLRSLWPSFPEVRIAKPSRATPKDYVLQVELTLDALAPDGTGPGWSAGVRGRYRLTRKGQVLTEGTLASRSRADLAYGAPLGNGATDVIDAAVVHVATELSQVEEKTPYQPAPLPAVASRKIPLENQEKQSPSKGNPKGTPAPQRSAKHAKVEEVPQEEER